MRYISHLLVLILLFGISACSGDSDVTPTHGFAITSSNLLPTQALQPTHTLAPSRPTYTSPLPSPTPDMPPKVQNLLPKGASVSEYSGWSLALTWSGTQVALPYRMPDDLYSLALLDDPTSPNVLYWDLRTEPLVAHYTWRDIRPLFKAPDHNRLSFVGLDGKGQWWIGVVSPALPGKRAAKLVALLPISSPEDVFYDYTWESDAIAEYYIVANRTLKIYRWSDDQAILLYREDNTPTDAVSARGADLNDVEGDQLSAVMLGWYKWGTDPYYATIKHQFIRTEVGSGYRSIGVIDTGYQRIDVDNDGFLEFLYPRPTAHPEKWEVIDRDDVTFTTAAPILRPVPPSVQTLDIDRLPALPAHLYFQRGNEYWRWPKEGSSLQQMESMPTGSVASCSEMVGHQSPYCWSPSGRYALIEIPAKIEGGSTGVYDTISGKTVEIPGTFVYVGGWNTFAWDPQEKFLIHARADGYGGLQQIDLPEIEQTSRLNLGTSLSSLENYGVVDPFVFSDGSIGFSIQGLEVDASLYPIFGVYRLTADDILILLAELPPLDRDLRFRAAIFRQLQWSPDGTAFLYHVLQTKGYQQPLDTQLLLGFSDGGVVYDLNRILGDAENFTWVP